MHVLFDPFLNSFLLILSFLFFLFLFHFFDILSSQLTNFQNILKNMVLVEVQNVYTHNATMISGTFTRISLGVHLFFISNKTMYHLILIAS